MAEYVGLLYDTQLASETAIYRPEIFTHITPKLVEFSRLAAQ